MGARYEGLVTVFLEYLGGFGGRIMDDSMRVTVDAPEAVRALTFMRDQIATLKIAPRDVLTWHEEETRFAFQNGRAAFMRNWPYAYSAMADTSQSRVAQKIRGLADAGRAGRPSDRGTRRRAARHQQVDGAPRRRTRARGVHHRAGAAARARGRDRRVSDATGRLRRARVCGRRSRSPPMTRAAQSKARRRVR